MGVPEKIRQNPSPVTKRGKQSPPVRKKRARGRGTRKIRQNPSRRCRSAGDVAGAAQDDVGGAADTDHVGRRGGSWAERIGRGARAPQVRHCAGSSSLLGFDAIMQSGNSWRKEEAKKGGKAVDLRSCFTVVETGSQIVALILSFKKFFSRSIFVDKQICLKLIL